MNASLGTKRQCPKCAARFYDLCAERPVCIKCNYKFPAPRATVAALKSSSMVVAKKPSKPKVMEVPDDLPAIDGMDDVIELEALDDFEEDIEHLEEVEDHSEAVEAGVDGDDADDEMFIDGISDQDPKLVDELEEEEQQE